MDRETIAAILNRPNSERLREYKYRFAQSTVFGLPVIALHFFGPLLGGEESGRWIGLFQMLLAGWVMYVGVMGMLVESLLRRCITADGLVALAAIFCYLSAVGALFYLFTTSKPLQFHGEFYWAVIASILWSAVQWFRTSKRLQ